MKTRIAVSGMPKSDRTLIAYALSQLTGIPFLQGRTMYEWTKLYEIALNGDFSWKENFLISSSAFIERIEMEGRAGSFISDGAVFSELMFLKLTKDIQKGNMPSERDKIMASLDNVCFGYAAGHYDLVAHIETPAPYRMPDETKLFESMFDSRDIPYEIYPSDTPEETMENIVVRLDIPTRMIVGNALYLANKNLYLK